MDKLANLILKSPVNTAIAVIICSVIPGLFVISFIILGLITLRKGAAASLPILVLVGGLLASVYYLMLGSLLIALYMAIILVLPIWALALVLRKTVSLEYMLLAAAALVALMAVLIMMARGWNLQGFFDLWVCQIGLTNQQGANPQAQAVVDLLSELAGLWPVSMFAQYVSIVLIARWWQARAFNPGGFQKEFHNIHFNKTITSVAAILIIVSLTMGSPELRSLSMVAVALLSIQGLSIVHWYCTQKKLSSWVLVPFYGVLFIAGWILIPVLLVLSLVDSFYSLRNRSALN